MAVQAIMRQSGIQGIPQVQGVPGRGKYVNCVERRDTLSENVFRHLCCPWLWAWSVKQHTGGGTIPRDSGPSNWNLPVTKTDEAWGPHTVPLYNNI